MSQPIYNTTSLPPITSNLLQYTDYVFYVVLGIVVLFFNTLICVVLLSNKLLLQRSALIAGIALGNLFLGFYIFASGVYRLAYFDLLYNATTIDSCLLLIIPRFYPVAFNTEAVFLFLASLERFLAINAPNWFRRVWTPKNTWLLFSVITCLIIFASLIDLAIPNLEDRSSLTWSCTPPPIYGKMYMKFLSAFTAATVGLGAALTTLALITGVRHIKKLPIASGEAGRYRKQLQLTKSILTVLIFELALMATPNVLSLMGNLNITLPSFVKASNSTYTNAANSIVAFFAFFLFNSQFRKATINLLNLHIIFLCVGQHEGQAANGEMNMGVVKTDQHYPTQQQEQQAKWAERNKNTVHINVGD